MGGDRPEWGAVQKGGIEEKVNGRGGEPIFLPADSGEGVRTKRGMFLGPGVA